MGSLLSPTGVTKPANSDKGSSFFGWIADLFQKFNDHTHNGSNSNRISASGVTAQTVSVLIADWGGSAPNYTVTKTLPGSMQYDQCVVVPCLTTGEQTNIKVTKSSSTAFILTSNQTLDLTCKVIS